MFSQVFLAVTAREMEAVIPQKTAYLACHLAAGGPGISNIPNYIPQGGILILDDSMPVQGHDPDMVSAQLEELAEKFQLRAVLLDFQREVTKEALDLAATALARCPGAVTPAYAAHLDCSVFLPPLPVNKKLQTYLAPWSGREVFLEIAPSVTEITVTSAGSFFSPGSPGKGSLRDSQLCCHYHIEVFPDRAVFNLYRNRQDLSDLIREAGKAGVAELVGLYQELHTL